MSTHRDGGDRFVEVKMTLTAPGCGMGDILVDDVRSKLEMIPTVAEADVELVFDPPWNRAMMSEAARLETGHVVGRSGVCSRSRACNFENAASVAFLRMRPTKSKMNPS